MKVVFIVTWAEVSPQNMGYTRSVYGRVLEEKRKGNKVVVFQIDYINDIGTRNEINEVEIDGVSFIHLMLAKLSLMENIKSIFSYKTREEYIYGTKVIHDEIDKAINKYNPSLIQVESMWVLPAVYKVSNVHLRLVVHDVIRGYYLSDIKSNPKYKQKINSIIKLIKILLREKRLLEASRINEYVFLTKEDASWYQRYLKKDITYTLASNSLDVKPIERDIDIVNPFFLYPGSVEFSQNYLAMKWFITDVLPLVENKITVIVTGKASDVNIENLMKVQSFHSIIFTGEIEREVLEELNSRCTAVISPIISGTGIKIKVLEAVQRGIPVISTKKSSNGIYSDIIYYSNNDTPEEYSKILNSFIEKNIKGITDIKVAL